jgi:hypothetical protein
MRSSDQQVSRDAKLRAERDRLSAGNSFVHYISLFQPAPVVYQAIGLYAQLAATLDLHLRRIYFALRAKGNNERGPERAHLEQILDRLPAAIQECELDLYRKSEFPAFLEVLRKLLAPRNDVVHSACRWQPDGNFLVFAHANEKVGREIVTGDGIAYWTVHLDDFMSLVRELESMAGYTTQYSATWLPKLRPWLSTYWDGAPDPNGTRTADFFASVRDAATEDDEASDD